VVAAPLKRERVEGMGAKLAQKVWRRCTGTDAYLMDYQFGDCLAEMRALVGATLRAPSILHVLYGDEQLDQLIRFRGLLRCPLVASFHLPSHRVAPRFEVFQTDIAKKIDAAVVLARNQIEPILSFCTGRKSRASKVIDCGFTYARLERNS
jgi:hypothetical protein